MKIAAGIFIPDIRDTVTNKGHGKERKTMANWVKWTQWNENGMVDHGEMPVRSIMEYLQKFELEAKKVLEQTGADHVLYGLKKYNGNKLEEVCFYLLPVSDDKYDDIAKMKNVVAYALHNRYRGGQE